MKILFNRYRDAKNRLIIPIRKFAAIDDNGNTIINTEPNSIEVLIVDEERTEKVLYKDFKEFEQKGLIKQLIL